MQEIKTTLCIALPNVQVLQEFMTLPMQLSEYFTQINLQKILADNNITLDMNSLHYGVYNKLVDTAYIIQPNDRIELYRPLICDPKELRRSRANTKHTR